MAKNLIVIPARYASTRLPAKPLAMIAGQTMLGRVVAIANAAANMAENCKVVVATDHELIANHCVELGVDYVMTDENCSSGTDRCAQALKLMKSSPKPLLPSPNPLLPSPPAPLPRGEGGDVATCDNITQYEAKIDCFDFVINLQGDAPLTPPDFVASMIAAYRANPADVVTLVTRLNWEELDLMRQQKTQTPFSGTTVAMREDDFQALWFSKQIIPAIRAEDKLRLTQANSPIWRHIGIYGYNAQMLERYTTMQESYYEQLEGLEQLRLLENGYKIRCVAVDYAGRASMSGVDSAQDVHRAEALIAKHGELL